MFLGPENPNPRFGPYQDSKDDGDRAPKTEYTATEYTLPFVDNLMSFRRYRWCKLEKAGRAFWMRNDNSTIAWWCLQPNETGLQNCAHKSHSFEGR